MPSAPYNRVRIIENEDGRYKVRIVAGNGRTLAESDRTYGRRDAAVNAARSLLERPLE